MENPIFRNRLWYEQPDPTRSPFSPNPSLRGVPVYHADLTPEPRRAVQRPADRRSGPKVVQIPVHFVGSKKVDRSGSAVKIQKVFRGFLVRKCLKKIKDIKAQVDEIEERLSKSEVVDSVRRNERERLRMNETLMSLLFKLDSIFGLDFGVRLCRKAVIRKAIALQERIDAIVATDLEANGDIGEEVNEIRVSEETDHSIKPDHLVNPSSEDSGELEGSFEDREKLENVGGGGDKSMEIEGNDEEAGVIDVGVDCEVKVSEPKGVYGNLDLVAEGVKEGLSEDDEKGKNDTKIDADGEGKAKEEKGMDDNKNNRELLEKMMEDNEKMMGLLTQLFERNEMQMRMMNALTHRVGLLEKAVVCDRLRKKKKKVNAAAQCEEN